MHLKLAYELLKRVKPKKDVHYTTLPQNSAKRPCNYLFAQFQSLYLPFMQLVVLLILALLVGIVYFHLGKKSLSESSLTNVINDRYANDIYNTADTIVVRVYSHSFHQFSFLSHRVGAFFFMTMNLVFTNFPSVELFIKQKALFM